VDQAIQTRITGLLSVQLGVERDQLVSEARILEDLGADSLDVVELVMALEEAFDLVVPDEDVESLRTLGDVAAYVDKRLS